jgi:UDP-glucose 4-epimerase
VKESVIDPVEYFFNNVSGSISLLKAMELGGCKNIIFSSSATVYGFPNKLPITEEHLTIPINPYGNSKLMIEKIIIDLVKSDKLSKAVILRYFNPIGCHPSSLIGDQPIGIPNNIMPILSKVVLNKDQPFKIFGSDYKTKDGTGVRDYIHVLDLAEGHLLALNKLKELEPISIFNLGTGKGYSVLEIIETFSRVSNFNIPYEFCKRREGDLDEIYADPSLANNTLNFTPKYSLENMCKSAWNYINNQTIYNEH